MTWSRLRAVGFEVAGLGQAVGAIAWEKSALGDRVAAREVVAYSLPLLAPYVAVTVAAWTAGPRFRIQLGLRVGGGTTCLLGTFLLLVAAADVQTRRQTGGPPRRPGVVILGPLVLFCPYPSAALALVVSGRSWK